LRAPCPQLTHTRRVYREKLKEGAETDKEGEEGEEIPRVLGEGGKGAKTESKRARGEGARDEGIRGSGRLCEGRHRTRDLLPAIREEREKIRERKRVRKGLGRSKRYDRIKNYLYRSRSF
jgi:hypothetical protein